MRDLARAAGVSPGAVSFALNDRSGVSERTRQRVKDVATAAGAHRLGHLPAREVAVPPLTVPGSGA